MEGRELGEPDLSEGRDGVDPDEVLVAGVGGRPDPAACVGEPLLQVAIERGVLVFLQGLRLDHRTATLALVPGASNRKGAPFERVAQARRGVADGVFGWETRSLAGLISAPRFPEPCAEVRFLPGAPSTRISARQVASPSVGRRRAVR